MQFKQSTITYDSTNNSSTAELSTSNNDEDIFSLETASSHMQHNGCVSSAVTNIQQNDSELGESHFDLQSHGTSHSTELNVDSYGERALDTNSRRQCECLEHDADAYSVPITVSIAFAIPRG